MRIVFVSSTRNDSTNAPILTEYQRAVVLTSQWLCQKLFEPSFWIINKISENKQNKTRDKFPANQNFIYISNLLVTYIL